MFSDHRGQMCKPAAAACHFMGMRRTPSQRQVQGAVRNCCDASGGDTSCRCVTSRLLLKAAVHCLQVVVMTSLDAETLPSTATAPTVSLQAAADPKGRPQKAKDVQQQLAAAQLPAPGQQQTASGQVAVAGQQQGPLPQGGQLATAGAEGTKPMGRQRTGGVLVDGPDYVEDKKETQPPVMDTIKLTNGCTLRWASAWTRPDRHAWTKRDWRSTSVCSRLPKGCM